MIQFSCFINLHTWLSFTSLHINLRDLCSEKCLYFKQILFIFCQITDIFGLFCGSGEDNLGIFKNFFPSLQISAQVNRQNKFQEKRKVFLRFQKESLTNAFPLFNMNYFLLIFLKQAESRPNLFGSQSEISESGLPPVLRRHVNRALSLEQCVILQTSHCPKADSLKDELDDHCSYIKIRNWLYLVSKD